MSAHRNRDLQWPWRIDVKTGRFVSFVYRNSEGKRVRHSALPGDLFDRASAEAFRLQFLKEHQLEPDTEPRTRKPRKPKKQYSFKGSWTVDPATGQYIACHYWNPETGKNERIPAKDIPENLFSLAEAEAFKAKYLLSIDAKIARAKKQSDFLTRFSKFRDEHEQYKIWAAETAKKGHKVHETYLRNYVYRFFLEENSLPNPDTWKYHYFEFRTWLKTVESIRTNTKSARRTLAVNTMNRIIDALNSFLTYLEKVHHQGPFFRCDQFKKEETYRKGLTHVYSDSEFEALCKGTLELDYEHREKLATYWGLLRYSGLRLMEGLGLHLDSIVLGEVPEGDAKRVFKYLQEYKLPCFGFIILKDQLARPYPRVSEIDPSVPRTPLKSRPEISWKHARYIPIINKELAEALDELLSVQEELFRKKSFGTNPEDYLLFDGLSQPELYRHFVGLRSKLSETFPNFSIKEIHDLRHTAATDFARMTDGDLRLTKMILGHVKDETAMNYVHLAEELAQQRASRDRRTPGGRRAIKAIEPAD